MGKTGQKVTKGIACALAAVVAFGTIAENAGVLFARETFSGLQNMIAGRKEFVIVEVVDDFEEASMGYLVDGQEPGVDVWRSGSMSSEEMTDLVEELRSRGLLTTGGTDDWSSYPLRYEITDTEYSEESGDKKLLESGFREQGQTMTSGYYVQVGPGTDQDDVEKALYRLDSTLYSNLEMMTPAELQTVAKTLLESYAPDHAKEASSACPKGYYETSAPGYFYYSFIAGTPEIKPVGSKSQSGSGTTDSAANPATTFMITSGAASAPTSGAASASTSGAASTSTSGAASAPTSGAAATSTSGITPATAPENAPAPNSGADKNNAAGNAAGGNDDGADADQTDAAADAADGNGDDADADQTDAAADAAGGNDDGADADQTDAAADAADGQEDATDVSSASAVIYVELDANNCILVASLDDYIPMNVGEDESQPEAAPAPIQEAAPTQEGTSEPTQEETPTPTQEGTPAPAQEGTPTPTQEETPAPTQEAESEPTQEGTSTPTQGESGDGNEGGGTPGQTEDSGSATDPEANPDDHESGNTDADADAHTLTFTWQWPDEGEPEAAPDKPDDKKVTDGTTFGEVLPEVSSPIEVKGQDGTVTGRYLFEGWFFEDGAKAESGAAVDADAALTGKWQYKESAAEGTNVTISFEFEIGGSTYTSFDTACFEAAEGGSCPELTAVEWEAGKEFASLPQYDEGMVIKEKSTGRRFRFLGWEQNPVTPFENMTIVGKWEELYTVKYEWEGAPDAGDGAELREIADDMTAGGKCELADISGWEQSVGENEKVQVNPDYTETTVIGKYQKDADGAYELLGVYAFSGWRIDGRKEVQTGEIVPESDITFKGEWTYTPNCTVTCEWSLVAASGDLPDGVSIETVRICAGGDREFDESLEILCPSETVRTNGRPYQITEYGEDSYQLYDQDGKLIGTCSFNGWRIDGEGEVQSGEITPEENITLTGEWVYEPLKHTVTYDWGMLALFGGSDSGVSMYSCKSIEGGVTLTGVDTEGNEKTVTLENPATLSDEIILPEAVSVEEGEEYTIDTTYKEGYEVGVITLDTRNGRSVPVPVGKLIFGGWEDVENEGTILDGGASMTMGEDDVTLLATWDLVLYSSQDCYTVQYAWSVNGIDGVDPFEALDIQSDPKKLGTNAKMPNGVCLKNGGSLDGEFALPKDVGDDGQTPNSYFKADDIFKNFDLNYTQKTVISVYDDGGVLVGEYRFSGWNTVKVGDSGTARELTPKEFREGFAMTAEEITAESGKDTVVTVSGTWTYYPEVNAGQIVGSGKCYAYIKDEIRNNNWFKYYVLGLEEGSDAFNNMNVRVITYLSDGSEKREYGTGTSFNSLGDALNAADLVYINTDGLDAEGNAIPSGRRLSTENARTLLSRACNEDKSSRLAVILDGSVRGNQADDNIKKVAAVLLQKDIAEVYASFSVDEADGGRVFEYAFTSDQWQKIAADIAIENNSNFVRDNIYCVSHQADAFGNSTYPRDNVSVNRTKLSALANADFENRFTDTATDAGFADVYQAIQKENYERAHNGSGQASMDEYVMPATAVAYILNYQEYDPIIYKDKIRVLELQPCRDYTYFYDVPDHIASVSPQEREAEQLKRKFEFAKDWAPDFKAKLENDPNAITIDGMTTSEFCGKILDIYEEYDIIYIGANDGVLRHKTEEGGLKWVKVASYDGEVSVNNNNNSSIRYTYHGGNWYESQTDGTKERIAVSSPGMDFGEWPDYATGNQWKWVEAEKSWYVKKAGTNDFVKTTDSYPGNYKEWWSEFGFEGGSGLHWYREQSVWSEEKLLPDGIGQDWYNAGGSNWQDNGDTWKWVAQDYKEWVNGVEVTHQRGWYQKQNVETITYPSYHDPAMNGMLYVHTGDLLNDGNGSGWLAAVDSQYNGHLANNGDQLYGYRGSGNDILKNQVNELLDYLKGGSLVILSEEFMTEDADGRHLINGSNIVHTEGAQTYRGIVDTSSYVYKFVDSVFEKDAWGNDVPNRPNLIVEGYGDGDAKDTVAFAEALNQQKVTLNLYSAPNAYDYQEEGAIGTIGTRALLQKESDGKYYLNYEFIIGNLSAVAPLTTRYHVQLFLDSNSDGIYNTATEELTEITVINAQTGQTLDRVGTTYQLQANVPYRVRRELPDGYVGCIGWKLKVTQIGNEHIHDSVTGLTAVPVQVGYNDQIDPVTGKKIIHVLQIVPNEYGVVNLEKETETEEKEGGDWNQLLVCLPDFTIDFDSIYYVDFAKSFQRPGENGYEASHDNGGVEGKLTGSNPGYQSKYGTNAYNLRNDYLNMYQYDMIIVGFTDSYPAIPSQAATQALVKYANTGKSMLFTHDTTWSGFSNAMPSDFTFSGNLGQPLSMSIRDICGMDRYGVSVDWYGYDADGKAYDNITANPLRVPAAAEMQYNAAGAAYQWYQTHNGGTRDVAYAPNSNQTMMSAQTQGLTYTMADPAYNDMFDWASHGMAKPTGNGMGLRKDTLNPDNQNIVTQVNSGIITQYPYDIPESIRVGDTHAQYYQLDLDTDWDGDGRGDVVCWYAIGSLNDGDWNDIYDFSPNDVRNNYYIFNKGNITYSGVGHFFEGIDVTTLDEKKLFINTFVAAYNAGVRNPSVRIVDGASINAPDLESVSIPFSGVDEASAGTYRVYYQVKDNNITQGTRNLSVRYYLEDAHGGSSTVQYKSNAVVAKLFADGELTTYSADTNLPVAYDEVRSGYTYYVDVPLSSLLDQESFNFYVEVDLTVAGSDEVAAFDVDRITIAKLKMFNLD